MRLNSLTTSPNVHINRHQQGVGRNGQRSHGVPSVALGGEEVITPGQNKNFSGALNTGDAKSPTEVLGGMEVITPGQGGSTVTGVVNTEESKFAVDSSEGVEVITPGQFTKITDAADHETTRPTETPDPLVQLLTANLSVLKR